MNDIVKLEHIVKQYEQVDIEVTHTFSDGVYVRQAFIPKDMLIVGKRHRHETINMLIKGRMIIYDGNESFEVEAPFTVVSKPYTKKAGLALEDSVWCNIHKVTTKDLEEIEKDVIITEEDFDKLITYKEQECLG